MNSTCLRNASPQAKRILIKLSSQLEQKCAAGSAPGPGIRDTCGHKSRVNLHHTAANLHGAPIQYHLANTGTLDSSTLGPGPGYVLLSEGPVDVSAQLFILLLQASPLPIWAFPAACCTKVTFSKCPQSLPQRPQTLAEKAPFTLPETTRNRMDATPVHNRQAARAPEAPVG